MAKRDRDHKGRFEKGNEVSKLGWQGLVNKRFDGDADLAREWAGKIGAHYYARQSGAGFSMELKECFAHPGTPEEFMARHRERVAYGQSRRGDQVRCTVGTMPDLPF